VHGIGDEALGSFGASSKMNNHPDFLRHLRALGNRAAERWLKENRNAVGKRSGWLRPEHRVGDPGRYMRHLLYVDPDDEFVITAITWPLALSRAARSTAAISTG